MIVLLGGCTMIPHYSRPQNPVSSEWPTGRAYVYKEPDAGLQIATDISWREFLADANLQEIIEMALKNNRDLRSAALNVEMARALYGVERASLLPSVNALGTVSKERVPADLSSTGSIHTAKKYSVNMGITSWEIDFFGRIRSLKERALQEYFATQEALQGTKTMLVAAVAQAYLALAADKEALQLASKTLETQEQSYYLIKKRYEYGMASELDLKRSQSQVEAARGDVARYTQMVAQDENGLNLLAGAPVPQKLLPENLQSVRPPRNISPGLTSEVLLRRPDVLEAEHMLQAANANIGAARAAFFPTISLTSTFGTTSAELSGLFKSGQSTWNFVPQIIAPIFDARTWFAYKATKVEKEILIAQYEKTIQTAFRETADALAERTMVGERITTQQALVDALADAYRLSQVRYTKGLDSYLSVLDAQRSLYNAQQGLIILRFAQVNNLITLYKTLGGGRDQ